MQFIDWAPTAGATVHIRADTRWNDGKIATGRYKLEPYAHDQWKTINLQTGLWFTTVESRLLEACRQGVVTPISRDELERERRELELQAVAPLRGKRSGPTRPQHDASDLALFKSANEPSLL